MQKTGLIFKWERGSKNDNAIEVLKENKIDWQYDHFFNLVADFSGIGLFRKVEYESIENDTFEICMA